MKFIEVKQETKKKFLNLFTLKFKDKNNIIKEYYLASRRNKEDLSCVSKKHNFCDAVMIVPITKDSKLVMIKQYRPIIDDYIYEFPAGIIDSGESIQEAAERELYEETGLKVIEYREILKPCYTSVGMTDESISIVEAIVDGIPTAENAEESEDIEIVLVDINQAKDIVERNIVSIKTALIIKGKLGEL